MNVIEATTPDQLLHRIEQTLPNVDRVLESVRDLSEDVRRIVNGPLQSVATRVDGLVQREAGHGHRHHRARRSLDGADRADHARTCARSPRAPIRGSSRSSTNLDDASAEAKDLVATAKSELTQTGDAIRGKLDKLDGVIDNTESITRKIDEDKGTLGRLVNDPEIADNVEQITDDAKGFLGTRVRAQDLRRAAQRVQHRRRAAAPLHQRSSSTRGRTSSTWSSSRRGRAATYPDVTLTFDPTVDPNHWIRRTVIQDAIRFTFQFAKRFSWLTLRYGIKESTGGIGADVDLVLVGSRPAAVDRRVRRHVRQVPARQADRGVRGVPPRLRARRRRRAAQHAARPASIVKGDSQVPIQFDTFRYGRDYFFGGMLRFNDEDLSALLAVGGSAVAGAAK